MYSIYREYSIFESDIYNIFYVNIHWLFGCLPPCWVGGNPACWDGHFTFARCCVAPGEDREVAAYVVQTLAKYERVGLYKDYLPGKDCFWGFGSIDVWGVEFLNFLLVVLDGIAFREFLDSIAKSLCISEFAICAKASLLSGSTMPCLHTQDLEYTDPDFFLGVLDTQDCWNPPVYTPELCCDLTQGVRFFFGGRFGSWSNVVAELKQVLSRTMSPCHRARLSGSKALLGWIWLELWTLLHPWWRPFRTMAHGWSRHDATSLKI